MGSAAYPRGNGLTGISAVAARAALLCAPRPFFIENLSDAVTKLFVRWGSLGS